MPNTTLPLNQLNNNDLQYVAAWISNNILDEDKILDFLISNKYLCYHSDTAMAIQKQLISTTSSYDFDNKIKDRYFRYIDVVRNLMLLKDEPLENKAIWIIANSGTPSHLRAFFKVMPEARQDLVLFNVVQSKCNFDQYVLYAYKSAAEDAYIQSQYTYTGSIGSNPADVQDANMPNPLVIGPLVISEHGVTPQAQADVEDLGFDEIYSAEEPDTDQEPNSEELQVSLSILEALKHALTFKISLLSEFPEDEIIISPNRFVALKSELDLGETCTYKAKVFTHCHSFACKASVMLYASLQLPITNLTKGEETFTSDIAATEWFLKHKNDEGLCSSYVLYPYNCADCGTLTSGKIREFTYNKLKINCIVCYLSSFKTCYYCNNVGSSINGSIDTNYVDGDVISVCSSCLSSLNECIKCGKLFKTKPLFNGYCIKCSPSVIMDYSYKPDPVFFDSPSDFAEPHLGIELEVEMKEGIVQYSNIIANRFLNAIDNEFIYLKKDSSISNGGFEIVSHPATLSFWHKNSNFWESIKKLTRTCESWSVDNCGMHVHISRSAFLNVDHIARFILFINTNRLLSAFVAERYNAKQAPFLDIDLEEAKKIVNHYYKIDRHSATNIQTNIPTVEVRIFKGNLKRQRIMKNLEFVHSLFRFTEKPLSCSVPEYLDFVAGNKQTYPNLHTYISKYKRKL